PVCVRHDAGDGRAGRACTIVGAPGARLELDATSCPAWVVPNAEARGYYRYDIPRASLVALGRAPLDDSEAVDLAYNLRALLYSGAVTLPDAMTVLAELARRPGRHVTVAVVELLTEIAERALPASGRGRF